LGVEENVPHGYDGHVYNGHVANIHDVAQRAGVSPTTAKRAINHPDQLAPKTLAKVQRAIAELQYEPDQRAAALRSGHNKTIGLIVGSIVEPFFASLTRTISIEVRKRDYGLLVADSEYRSDLELRHLKHLYGHRVAGLLLRSGYGEPNLEYLTRMQRGGTAIVEVDHHYPKSPFAKVMLDGRGAVEQGVDYLLSLGHTRIAAIGAYHPLLNPDERSQAFLEIMQARGVTVPNSYRVAISPVQEEAYRAAKTIMRQAEPPTALFALAGSISIGVYQALREMHIQIPQDISLLAFDNYPWTTLVSPQIDVLEQPTAAIAKTAVNILFDTMTANEMAAKTAAKNPQDNKNPQDTVLDYRLPATLIKRGSCSPISSL
jgi:LacI family transcriptional regulator